MITGTWHSDYHKVKATSSTLHSDIIEKPERTQIIAKQNQIPCTKPPQTTGATAEGTGVGGSLN